MDTQVSTLTPAEIARLRATTYRLVGSTYADDALSHALERAVSNYDSALGASLSTYVVKTAWSRAQRLHKRWGARVVLGGLGLEPLDQSVGDDGILYCALERRCAQPQPARTDETATPEWYASARFALIGMAADAALAKKERATAKRAKRLLEFYHAVTEREVRIETLQVVARFSKKFGVSPALVYEALAMMRQVVATYAPVANRVNRTRGL